MSIFYENREIVTPGDLLAEGEFEAGRNTYKIDSKIYACKLGLVEYKGKTVHVVALNTFYVPSVGDTVIGKIIEINLHGWTVDIDSPYLATLRPAETFNKSYNPQKNELSEFLNIGDLIQAKIIAYDRTRNPLLTIKEPGLGKITRGQIVKVSPAKIPRIIGRKGSMINMLKRETRCNIVVGQNGLIHIYGRNPEDERIAVLAIKKIELEAHTSGLTDRIVEMIHKERRGVV